MDKANTAIRQVDGVYIVDILKDMDFLTGHAIQEQLTRLMDEGKKRIIGNLLAVRLVDSSGLQALATAQIKARTLHIHFSIVLANSNIRKLLASSGLDVFLDIHKTEEEAVQHMLERR